MNKPPFPINVECLDVKEGREVHALHEVVAALDQTLPNDKLAEVFCGHPSVQRTLRGKKGFWAVVIGSPGVYRTQ
jgi:hypothetical protein